tara:strand:+ start:375 stop:494 length:120 start_codon:yes stop_codon:yes gene_type:complete
MIKKVLLILFCSIFLFSCGKKADPEYKETKKNKIQLIII